MKELVMYRCEICGNLICMIEDSGVVPECCGMEMRMITANTEDAAAEKHVPVMRRDGISVQIMVGGAPHPMTEAHHINWILLLTNKGVHFHKLDPSSPPETIFNIRIDEDVICVYAYCNVHGLWKNNG